MEAEASSSDGSTTSVTVKTAVNLCFAISNKRKNRSVMKSSFWPIFFYRSFQPTTLITPYEVNSMILCSHTDSLFYEAKIIAVKLQENGDYMYTVHYQVVFKFFKEIEKHIFKRGKNDRRKIIIVIIEAFY